ncbi:MAG: hypothetical protein SFW67_15280 [Myxococcaceae bacterium]|nr:hypothetical protein [Myxococcaceae bacterium]
MSNAVCAMSAVPLWRESFAFLVIRIADGLWEPFSAVTTVGLDDYQCIIEFEPTTPPAWLSLAASVWPNSEDPIEELVQHRIEEMPVPLGRSTQVALALVEPSMARAVVKVARSRGLGRTAAQLLQQAFPRAGVRAARAAERPSPEALHLVAALSLLKLPLEPFRSVGGVPGHDFADVAGDFDRARARVAGFPELREALKSVEQLWRSGLEPRRAADDGEDDELDEDEVDELEEDDEDDFEEDDEDEKRPSMEVRRSFTGSYTVAVLWEARAAFADAVKSGGRWNTLSIETAAGPALVSPTADGFRLTISPADADALAAAVRVGEPWCSPEGETCVEVWGRPR